MTIRIMTCSSYEEALKHAGPGDVILVSAVAMQLLNYADFISRYRTHCQTEKTYKAAYEKTEKEYQAIFNKRRYVDHNSFKAAMSYHQKKQRCKKIKTAQKQIK